MNVAQPGQILGGTYRLERPLGEGGMGSVWHAEHLTLKSPIALKLIDPLVAKNPEAVDRFLREARTAAALRSPHVVQILDYGVEGESPYIAMEMLEGETLAERLTRLGRLNVAQTTQMLRHVARAMGRAHEAGIVHRDLKPENIFIVRNDDEEVFKVLDFGIVKGSMMVFDHVFAATATRTGTLIGTPSYMSPEQAEGVRSVDFRADVWALGVVTFKCLLGQLPFRGETIGRLILEICTHRLPVPSEVGEVPQGFDAWFERACARDPNARFASAKEAADAFECIDPAASSRARAFDASPVALDAEPFALVDGEPRSLEVPQGGTQSLVRRSGRRQTIAVAVSALAVAGVLWVAGWRGHGSPTSAVSPAAAQPLTSPVTAQPLTSPVTAQPLTPPVTAQPLTPLVTTQPLTDELATGDLPAQPGSPLAAPRGPDVTTSTTSHDALKAPAAGPGEPGVAAKPTASSQRRKARDSRRKAARSAARRRERVGVDLGI